MFLPSLHAQDVPPAVADALFYHACMLVGGILLALTASLAWLRFREGRRGGVRSATPSDSLRDTLAFGVAGLWILDGFLQMQPLMVTQFTNGFLSPLVQGQPAWVQGVIRLGLHIWGASPIWWNVGATFIQIMIGVSILLSRDGSPWRRATLWVSLAWCLTVWSATEAFGSLFAGGGVVVGTPGSVVFYGLAAAVLLLPARSWHQSRLQAGFRWGGLAFFLLMAFLQAWPANGWWGAGGLSGAALSMAQTPQPGWLAAPLTAWALTLKAHPALWNAAWLASELALAAAWLLRPRSAATFWATLVWNLAAWYLWQDFGVFGGMGTDPNTGGIILVFLVLYGRFLGRMLPAQRAYAREGEAFAR